MASGPIAHRCRRARGEEGSAIAELVIVAPVLLIVIVLMIALGRVDSAQGDVESAARAGVQAAVVQADPSDAESQATSAAQASLTGAGLTCTAPQITRRHVELRGRGLGVGHRHLRHQPGRRLGPGHVPGDKTFSATSTAHIDPFRAVATQGVS